MPNSPTPNRTEDEKREATVEQIAAAWGAWRVRHPTLSIGPGPGFREAIAAALAVEPAESTVSALRERVARLEEALRLTLRFTDYAAGEGIAFVPSPDEAEMDAADICTTVARTLNIELGGPEYMAIVAHSLPTQPAAEGGADEYLS